MTTHFRRIRRAALTHHKQVVQGFHAAHKHARRLLKKHRVVIHKVRDHSFRTAAVASISTGLLAGPALMATANTAQAEARHSTNPETVPNVFAPNQPFEQLVKHQQSLSEADMIAQFQDRINKVAPGNSSNLTADQSAAVTQVIQETFGITATTQLEGVSLQKTRGDVWGEQHLPRYRGDTIDNFFKNPITGEVADPTANLTGMVPGLPSWGYFAQSKASMTKLDVDREQWYIAAQTFLAPGWQENTNKLYNFFKYRKMIMINQDAGMAVVVDIADAGPSPYTGRTFGANNPVLIGLGLGQKRHGQVMVLFVDDPGDTIPLGPLTGYHP